MEPFRRFIVSTLQARPELQVVGEVSAIGFDVLCGRSLRSVQLGGQFYKRGERIGFHLLHDLCAVRFHCNLADAEFAANLFIQQSGDD
jgi:hypothetical protein